MHWHLIGLLGGIGDVVLHCFPGIGHEYHQQVEGNADEKLLPCLLALFFMKFTLALEVCPGGSFSLHLDNLVSRLMGLVQQEILA